MLYQSHTLWLGSISNIFFGDQENSRHRDHTLNKTPAVTTTTGVLSLQNFLLFFTKLKPDLPCRPGSVSPVHSCSFSYFLLFCFTCSNSASRMPSARLRIPPAQPDRTMNDRSNSKTFFIGHLRVNVDRIGPRTRFS